MRIALCAPNVSFVTSAEGAEGRIKAFEAEGLRMERRQVGMVEVASAFEPVIIDVETVAELIALRDRLGLPLVLESGDVVEVRST